MFWRSSQDPQMVFPQWNPDPNFGNQCFRWSLFKTFGKEIHYCAKHSNSFYRESLHFHIFNHMILIVCVQCTVLIPLLPSSLSISGRWGKRGCMPCSHHLPIPLLACATLHLLGIKFESPERTERKKDKKIGSNENQKHPLSLSFLFPPPPPFLLQVPLFAMNLERRESRRIKFNSKQPSAAPDDRALKCKCACVSFSLSSSLSYFFLLFFYVRRGKAFKRCSLTFHLLV